MPSTARVPATRRRSVSPTAPTIAVVGLPPVLLTPCPSELVLVEVLTMPTAYGAEFRQDVIDVARKGEAPLAQIAKDFGLSVTTLKRWVAIAKRKESGAGSCAV